jgi:stage II sporulation protein Q
MFKFNYKKVLVPALYLFGILVFLGGMFLIEWSLVNDDFNDKDDYDYVSKTIFDDEIAVIATDELVIRPYIDTEITVVKGYYDYKAEAANQESALIYHEDTYIQSSGTSYGGKENFDVVAVLKGTIISVKEDNLLGKIVEIKHTNDVISVYQSLSTVNVKENDTVKQGDVIGKSGLSNISKELNSHLYFEIISKGQIVNPEEVFNKKASEI